MVTPSDPPPDEIEISISREIYDALREFCDQNNLRFKYFIEEALESAPRRDHLLALSYESSALLKRVKHLMNKMEDERQRSYARGFAQGMLVAMLNSAGYSGVSDALLPEEIRNPSRTAVPRDDRQLSLFD
ncbi:MAG: hypothetical protein WBG37_02625 [Desulfobacterales bacterium]